MDAPGSSFTRLVAIMDRLLAPDGCPWDREQTLDTLRPYLVEETYEVLDALERGTAADHCEELGDLLMQIVFQSALRRAEGAFAVDDVIASISDKLVRRHPHVFGDAEGVHTADQVLVQWDRIKAQEKQEKQDKEAAADAPARVLDGIPRALPALARAQQIGRKVAKVGFDWPGYEGSLAKVREEVDEVDEAAVAKDAEAAHREIGDLLFAAVNLARHLQVDAEMALQDASARFSRRFAFVEDRLAEAGKRPADSDLTEMDRLWDDAKRAEREGGGALAGGVAAPVAK
jgi:tetrapyrrole methylase family protein/MazG family protein/ATP diphosphatase